jgi:type I restriction enzyme S subunit
VDEGIPILFGNNIGRGELHLENLRYISLEADQEFASCRVSAGDLLTIRVGDPGATVVVPLSLDGCHFASAMWIRQGTFDSEWLCNVMNSKAIAVQIDGVNYGAAQEQFNIGDAANFLFPVPPLKEQKTLALSLKKAVGAFDALIAEAERAITLLQERRSALISAAVTGQIDVRAVGGDESGQAPKARRTRGAAVVGAGT